MIQEVRIKKYTVLKNFVHDFANRNVLICGSNGLGKSSVLNFIKIALGNTDVIPPNAEGSGEVWVNKQGQEYHLKVEVKNGKSKVTITGEDNLSDSRRGALAGIIGAVDLNVNSFIEMSKTEKGRKQQVELFKGMLPKETQAEILRLEANVKTAFDERTELSRDVKKKETEITTSPLNHLIPKEIDKFKQVDVSAVMEDLKTIQAHNKKVQDIIDRQETRKEEIAKLKVEIALMEEKAQSASDYLAQPANKIQDVVQYEEKIKNATKSNQNFADAQKLKADQALIKTMLEEQENYTIRIESGRQAIQDAIKDMAGDLVPGVTYNEEGLIWNGLLVHPNTHSTGEQLELAMKLKMAENPDLQVMFLEHTESIDEDRMNHILQIAKTNGWQILGEEVRKKQGTMTFEIIGE